MDLFSRMPHFAKFGGINFREWELLSIWMGSVFAILTFFVNMEPWIFMQIMIDPEKFVPQLLSLRISSVRFALLKKIETIHSISAWEKSSEIFPKLQK